MNKSITLNDLQNFEDNFDRNPQNAIAANAVTKNGIADSAISYEKKRELVPDYSLEVEAGDVCDQKRSGRCWMFAATNVMRVQVMEKLQLKNFELSQNYPFFFDKLEKSNFFLENILDTLDEPRDGRLVNWLLQSPVGDGGQWDMFVAITKKYGACPKQAMPETFSSSNSNAMCRYITLKLREDASILRSKHEAGASIDELRALKEEMLQTIYNILVICLGKPPVSFTFETRIKNNEFIRIENITPKDFYDRYVGLNLDDYVSVINAPTADKPYHRSFTVKYLGSICGEPVRYVNLPMDEFKKLAVTQLQNNELVWFGSDVGQFSTGDGLMSESAMDVEALLGTTFGMDKATRLDYSESLMTHAMVLAGVNLDSDGNPDRWKVENSWGKDRGYQGFYAMDDNWFDEYVYQIVINKKYLTQEQLDAYNSEPIKLEPWDPMGSLAI